MMNCFLKIFLALILMVTPLTVSVSATVPVKKVYSEQIEIRAAYTLMYPAQKTFTVNHSVSRVLYTGVYGLFGNKGVVILRFINQNTGDFKSFTFICDNNYHNDPLTFTLPAGTYDVYLITSSVKNLTTLNVNFAS